MFIGGVLNDVDQVPYSMGDSVGRRDGWELVLVLEEFGCTRDADAIGGRDEETVAAVMLEGRPQIPGEFAVRAPTGAGVRVLKDDGPCARRCEGGSIEVEYAM